MKAYCWKLQHSKALIGFVIALLEQNHKIKDWRIDIKKAVSKDSSSSNQGYGSNRGEGRGFNLGIILGADIIGDLPETTAGGS